MQKNYLFIFLSAGKDNFYPDFQATKRVEFSVNTYVYVVQCNLDLATLKLVTTCYLVTILQRPFFNLLCKIIRYCDIM